MKEDNEMDIKFDEGGKTFTVHQTVITGEMEPEEILALNTRWEREKQACEAILAKSDDDMLTMFLDRLAQGSYKSVIRFWILELAGMGDVVAKEKEKFIAEVKKQMEDAKKGIKKEKEDRRRRLEELLKVLSFMKPSVAKANAINNLRVKKGKLKDDRAPKAAKEKMAAKESVAATPVPELMMLAATPVPTK